MTVPGSVTVACTNDACERQGEPCTCDPMFIDEVNEGTVVCGRCGEPVSIVT